MPLVDLRLLSLSLLLVRTDNTHNLRRQVTAGSYPFASTTQTSHTTVVVPKLLVLPVLQVIKVLNRFKAPRVGATTNV